MKSQTATTQEQKKPCKFVYHKKLGFPDSLIPSNKLYRLIYTTHALDRREVKYGGLENLPKSVTVSYSTIVEAHTNDNIFIKKAVVRIKFNTTEDIILVLEIPKSNRFARVITFYINKKEDSHQTLNINRYNTPQAA